MRTVVCDGLSIIIVALVNLDKKFLTVMTIYTYGQEVWNSFA